MNRAAIRLLIVDDHSAFRQPFAFMLDREPDMDVIAQAATLAEARQSIEARANELTLALIDLRLPDGIGIDLIREFKQANPDANSLMLTADQDRLQYARAIEAGAAGVLSKTASIDDIIHGIRRANCGESIQTTQEIIELLRIASQERDRDQVRQVTLGSLTPREREVLQTLSEGLDNRAIADRLFISPETARTHVVKLLSKLNVESRLQAAIYAIENGVGSSDLHRSL